MNLILLCGLDGTGVLFKPFLEAMPSDIKNSVELFIYDLNASDDNDDCENQDLMYQSKRIERQIQDKFADESVVIIAESYSGLLAYHLLLNGNINIERVFFIACFLQRPSNVAHLAKYAYFIQPKWTSILNDRVFSHLLFNRFGSAELLALFRKSMSELEQPKKRAKFYQRCENIANLPKELPKNTPHKPDYKNEDKITFPCVYLQANQDNLVQADNVAIFQQLFTDLTIVRLEGSHFLLQTNPVGVWTVFSQISGF